MPPEKPKKARKIKEEKMTSPEEYFGTPEERLKTKSKGSKLIPTKQSNHSVRKKKVVANNVLNKPKFWSKEAKEYSLWRT